MANTPKVAVAVETQREINVSEELFKVGQQQPWEQYTYYAKDENEPSYVLRQSSSSSEY